MKLQMHHFCHLTMLMISVESLITCKNVPNMSDVLTSDTSFDKYLRKH